MKKILSICFLVLMVQSCVFADEILDSQGNIVPCKIETVMGGLIEYYKDGNRYSFVRSKDQPIFNDYVDVRDKLTKKGAITRYNGKILVRDAYGVRIQNGSADMIIPWYRVKFIGVYKP